MLMLSVPAAIMMSASPVRMRSAAIDTAFSPDEQKRLIVMPATRVRQAREQQADARDVHALLVFGHRAADDHVLDAPGIDRRHLREHARSTCASSVSGRVDRNAPRGALPTAVRVAATM